VVVDTARRGQRLGHVVMAALAAKMRAQGCAIWTLNVKPDNVPAVKLYERWGFALAHRSGALRVPWSLVESLPAAAGVATRLLAADGVEDAAAEAAVGAGPASLAAARARGASTLVVALAAGEAQAARALGVAAFDPRFPGAFPFRVAPSVGGDARRGGVARALLEEMRKVARPEFDFTRVVVEADDALRATLVAIGAELLLDFVHMRGAVPAADAAPPG
jgi:GNAT superfamily N-acetyltransferase